MKKILLSLLFFSFCSNAIDENQIQFKIDSCKSIANKDERLNCYDALSNVETITIPTKGIGNWTIFKDKSPLKCRVKHSVWKLENKWIRCPEPILQFCQFVSRLAGARNYIDGIERMSRDRKFG